MAKGILEITMDFKRANAQAAELESVARELQTLANTNFENCISEIHANWTGENAEAYLKKCRTVKDKMLKTAKQLKKTADTIRRIAKEIYDAEMAAAAIAALN